MCKIISLQKLNFEVSLEDGRLPSRGLKSKSAGESGGLVEGSVDNLLTEKR
jgi:hypothetical protein